jgi:hypothetical protein
MENASSQNVKEKFGEIEKKHTYISHSIYNFIFTAQKNINFFLG